MASKIRLGNWWVKLYFAMLSGVSVEPFKWWVLLSTRATEHKHRRKNSQDTVETNKKIKCLGQVELIPEGQNSSNIKNGKKEKKITNVLYLLNRVKKKLIIISIAQANVQGNSKSIHKESVQHTGNRAFPCCCKQHLKQTCGKHSLWCKNPEWALLPWGTCCDNTAWHSSTLALRYPVKH